MSLDREQLKEARRLDQLRRMTAAVRDAKLAWKNAQRGYGSGQAIAILAVALFNERKSEDDE